MALDFSAAPTIQAAGASLATISSSGTVALANRPAFLVHHSASAVSAGSDIVHQTISYNNGSHYNSTNGRFTAPVAGVYHFTFKTLPQNASTGEFRYALYKNGVGYNEYIIYKASAFWNTAHYVTHIPLLANDYVTIRYVSGSGTTYLDANFNTFAGHLIG